MNKTYYYDLALPVNINSYYTYSCNTLLEPGCRALINFNGRLLTAYVYKQTTKPYDFTAKAIDEVVDTKSKISADIWELAIWISNYYACPLGMVLYSVMPKGMQLQVTKKARLLTNNYANIDENQKKIVAELNTVTFTDLNLIKVPKLHYNLEVLEDQKIIELQRTIDAKIKPKKVNFVKFIKDFGEKLTEKQASALQLIKSYQEVKQSIIAVDYSYSTLKSLENKGLVEINIKNVTPDDPLKPDLDIKYIKPEYTNEQSQAISAINTCVDNNTFAPFLLYGVTGSGKTEVYIEVIKKCLSQNKTALLLVPEISLTPQMISRFYAAFDDNLAILHSKLNEKKRWQQYKNIYYGKAKIVIGVRSAVFAPLKNIGVVICDEEHESSYKQENSPRYNARDLAVVRAKKHSCPVILGSATPSLESFVNAENGKYKLLKLTKRPFEAIMPEVSIIDMKNYEPKTVFSDELKNAIQQTLENKNQIILFQNRRGYAGFMQCTSCGELLKCSKCDISLSYHKSTNKLKCHYCDLQKPMPRSCPNCGGYSFNYGSFGTQSVEAQLEIFFPSAKIMRMDADTTNSKDSYTKMFEKMKNREIDILLGTQMIAKGLDFENVTLVGVISADTAINIPDFRAAERSFQLLTQVAGRSGRGKHKGKVIIQTLVPEHYAILTAKNQNFDEFSTLELELRKALDYPPYTKMARLVFASTKEYKLQNLGLKQIADFLNSKSTEIQVLGPAEAPITKINNEHRIHVIIKAKKANLLTKAVKFLTEHTKLPNDVKLSIDIDPISLL